MLVTKGGVGREDERGATMAMCLFTIIGPLPLLVGARALPPEAPPVADVVETGG